MNIDGFDGVSNGGRYIDEGASILSPSCSLARSRARPPISAEYVVTVVNGSLMLVVLF